MQCQNLMLFHLMIECFNTASGMDCMQLLNLMKSSVKVKVSIPQAVWIACNMARRMSRGRLWTFQYRKRYGLHAISRNVNMRKSYEVSIPQAVWIACNEIIKMEFIGKWEFQYRKRYGLHAILSPGSLGNSGPKSRFSNIPSLFAFFPKPRGIFLSRKVLQKGLEGVTARKLLSTRKTWGSWCFS